VTNTRVLNSIRKGQNSSEICRRHIAYSFSLYLENYSPPWWALESSADLSTEKSNAEFLIEF
jgi:hypothetical protein